MGIVIKLVIMLSFCLFTGAMLAQYAPQTFTLIHPNYWIRWIHVIMVGCLALGARFTVSK